MRSVVLELGARKIEVVRFAMEAASLGFPSMDKVLQRAPLMLPPCKPLKVLQTSAAWAGWICVAELRCDSPTCSGQMKGGFDYSRLFVAWAVEDVDFAPTELLMQRRFGIDWNRDAKSYRRKK